MEVLTKLNELTPLGVIAFALLIIYLQIKNKNQVKNLEINHLSDLPDICNALKRIEENQSKELDILHRICEDNIMIKNKINNVH